MTKKSRSYVGTFFHVILLGIVVIACSGSAPGAEATGQPLAPADPPEGLAFATFAGGCFWCMEPPFDKLYGVKETISGYTGGPEKNPSYDQVSMGATGHAEVVRVVYDPAKVSYETLIDVFWRNIDPTVKDRQFCDWGRQYRTAIYYHDDAQKQIAESTLAEIGASGQLPGPIVTEIVAAGDFYPAEDYHQNFYKKNPVRYKTYRVGCGRDRRLEELWGE
jgi:peptide-methionine (S)-S-oxide reductase